MIDLRIASLLLAGTLSATLASVSASTRRQQVPTSIGFETRDGANRPSGWYSGGAGYEVMMDSSSPMAGKYSLRTRWPARGSSPRFSLRRRDKHIRRSVRRAAVPCDSSDTSAPKTSPAAMPDSGCASMVGPVPLRSTTWRSEARRARRRGPGTKSSCRSIRARPTSVTMAHCILASARRGSIRSRSR